MIPYDADAYTAVDSNFTFLEFGESSLPGVVYVEGLEAHLCLERPSDLARYAASTEYLPDTALTPAESVRFIEGIREEQPDISKLSYRNDRKYTSKSK